MALYFIINRFSFQWNIKHLISWSLNSINLWKVAAAVSTSRYQGSTLYLTIWKTNWEEVSRSKELKNFRFRNFWRGPVFYTFAHSSRTKLLIRTCFHTVFFIFCNVKMFAKSQARARTCIVINFIHFSCFSLPAIVWSRKCQNLWEIWKKLPKDNSYNFETTIIAFSSISA